jgi:hypothetical protein
MTARGEKRLHPSEKNLHYLDNFLIKNIPMPPVDF